MSSMVLIEYRTRLCLNNFQFNYKFHLQYLRNRFFLFIFEKIFLAKWVTPMMLDITDIVALFTAVQLLFLTIVSFNYKKGKHLSSLLLSGFMASNALLILQYLLSHLHIISREKFTLIFSIGSASYLLLMPFLYLYIISLCYNDFRFKKTHLLHFVPFVAVALFSFVLNSFNNVRITNSIILTESAIKYIEPLVRKIIIHLQILSYLTASVITLIFYRRRLKELYSSVEKIDLGWCNLLLAAFTVMWSLDLLSWSLGSLQIILPASQHWMFFSSLLINLTFTIAVTYKGLLQSKSFSGIREPRKYASSRLKLSECEEIVRTLTDYMKSEKPYLMPSLSVDDLTKKINIPARNLSQALRTCLNKNFYDLINDYRIEEVKQLIADKSYQNQTFLALAYTAGFNSKSVFNAAFKKYTGMTPREYKNKQSVKSSILINPTHS
jgi:AraC-like DNA-binding protein